LGYLKAIGVDPSRIRVVVATHWDDDHVNGLGETFEAAVSAKFVASSALSSPELLSVLASWGLADFVPGGSGVTEIRRILMELGRRAKLTNFPSPIRACHNRIIWERPLNGPVEVRTLSPSDAANAAATARLGELAAQSTSIKRRLPRIEDNHASVVLAITAGNVSVLLGADLEVRADRAFGWHAITDAHQSPPVHEFVKISHHGSENGDSDDIWTKLCMSDPLCVTTPFVGGRTRLPTKKDCQRIMSRGTRAYLTALPIPRRLKAEDRALQKIIQQMTLNAQIVPGGFGHVRARKKMSGKNRAWDIQPFGSAIEVKKAIRAL
jgi:hypothetical protein